MPTQVEGPNIIYGVSKSPQRHAREGSSTWNRMFKKWTIVSSALDQSENYSRQLGSDRSVSLAPEISVQRITANIVIELAAETVFAHADRGLGRHPERRAQPGVAVLGEVAVTAGSARLLSGKIQCRRTSRTGDDARSGAGRRPRRESSERWRTDARHRHQPAAVGIVSPR